jgi:hypothetical protein
MKPRARPDALATQSGLQSAPILEETTMLKTAALALGLGLAGVAAATAQDIAGVEDCTKTTGLDKRTGCLQANINFLQQLVTKNTLEARARLNAATAEITALKTEIVGLKAAVASLQASVEQLKAAQKPAEKKPDEKDKKAK